MVVAQKVVLPLGPHPMGGGKGWPQAFISGEVCLYSLARERLKWLVWNTALLIPESLDLLPAPGF